MRKRYFQGHIKLILALFLIAVFPVSLFAQSDHHMDHMMMSTPASTTPSSMQKPQPKIQKSKSMKIKKSMAMHRGSQRIVDLYVGYKMVNFAGRWRRAIAVNDQIPAPTLHFKEGELSSNKINVIALFLPTIP